MASLPTKPSIGSSLPSVKYPVLMQVLQAIADGATPSAACKEHGLSLASLRYHLKNDDELRVLFDEALDIGSDALADLLVDIDKLHSAPAMAGVISKNIQWVLERRKPDKFGARVQVSMENNATKTLIGALDAAIARIPMATFPQIPSRQIVDVEAEVVERPKKRTVPLPAPSNTQAPSIEELRLLGLA